MMKKHDVGLAIGDGDALIRMGSKARIIDFSAAWSISKNSLRISIRYPANFLIWAILPLLWLLPFVFTGIAFSGGTINPLFGSQSGHAAFRYDSSGDHRYEYALHVPALPSADRAMQQAGYLK